MPYFYLYAFLQYNKWFLMLKIMCHIMTMTTAQVTHRRFIPVINFGPSHVLPKWTISPNQGDFQQTADARRWCHRDEIHQDGNCVGVFNKCSSPRHCSRLNSHLLQSEMMSEEMICWTYLHFWVFFCSIYILVPLLNVQHMCQLLYLFYFWLYGS